MCQQRDYAGPAVRLGRTSCKPLTVGRELVIILRVGLVEFGRRDEPAPMILEGRADLAFHRDYRLAA